MFIRSTMTVSVAGFILCSGLLPISEPSTSTLKPYDAWSDCEAFCNRASTEGNSEHVSAGMMCMMECDVAAQFEGQEIDDEATAALRDQLICAQKANTCTEVNACIQP